MGRGTTATCQCNRHTQPHPTRRLTVSLSLLVDPLEDPPQDLQVDLPSRYLRQLSEIYPSGLRWRSRSWEPGENQSRNHRTTTQVLPSQRAAIIRTEARAAAKSNHSICQQAHTLSLYTLSLVYSKKLYIHVRCISFGICCVSLY